MAARGAFENARILPALAIVGAALSLSACATAPSAPVGRLASEGVRVRAYNRPYEVRGRWYTPAAQPGYDRVGLASWYSYESRSRTTADGEPFDARLATAAHTTLPIPSWIEVTNLDNGRSARIRLNDRGPFVPGRILDISRAGAEELGFLQRGTARVRVRYLGPAEPRVGGDAMYASAPPPRRRSRAVAAPAPHVELVQERLPPSTSTVGAPTLAEAEVDKDLADFGGGDGAVGAPAEQAVGGYAVQAGAFADRANAERAVARLAEAGPAQVLPLQRGDGEVLYRVVLGDWPQAQSADDARARIAALGFTEAKVVAR